MRSFNDNAFLNIIQRSVDSGVNAQFPRSGIKQVLQGLEAWLASNSYQCAANVLQLSKST